jgi:hypothetical protein
MPALVAELPFAVADEHSAFEVKKRRATLYYKVFIGKRVALGPNYSAATAFRLDDDLASWVSSLSTFSSSLRFCSWR